jgi:hypothetical protein
MNDGNGTTGGNGMRLPLVLRERREDIARGMRGLCDAVGALAIVRDAVEAHVKDSPVAMPNIEALLLKLARTCKHLTEAAADVPNECWGAMLDGSAGADELRARLTSETKRAA